MHVKKDMEKGLLPLLHLFCWGFGSFLFSFLCVFVGCLQLEGAVLLLERVAAVLLRQHAEVRVLGRVEDVGAALVVDTQPRLVLALDDALPLVLLGALLLVLRVRVIRIHLAHGQRLLGGLLGGHGLLLLGSGLLLLHRLLHRLLLSGLLGLLGALLGLLLLVVAGRLSRRLRRRVRLAGRRRLGRARRIEGRALLLAHLLQALLAGLAALRGDGRLVRVLLQPLGVRGDDDVRGHVREVGVLLDERGDAEHVLRARRGDALERRADHVAAELPLALRLGLAGLAVAALGLLRLGLALRGAEDEGLQHPLLVALREAIERLEHLLAGHRRLGSHLYVTGQRGLTVRLPRVTP
jgi:hypothetical protein